MWLLSVLSRSSLVSLKETGSVAYYVGWNDALTMIVYLFGAVDKRVFGWPFTSMMCPSGILIQMLNVSRPCLYGSVFLSFCCFLGCVIWHSCDMFACHGHPGLLWRHSDPRCPQPQRHFSCLGRADTLFVDVCDFPNDANALHGCWEVNSSIGHDFFRSLCGLPRPHNQPVLYGVKASNRILLFCFQTIIARFLHQNMSRVSHTAH